MNTNKIDLIKAEVERIQLYTQSEVLKQVLEYINSLQEEPVRRTSADIESAMQEVEEKSKAFTEAHKGESSDEILAQMRGEEPVSNETMTIRKEWFEHCKKSWYNEGYIDGKHNQPNQFEMPDTLQDGK